MSLLASVRIVPKMFYSKFSNMVRETFVYILFFSTPIQTIYKLQKCAVSTSILGVSALRLESGKRPKLRSGIAGKKEAGWWEKILSPASTSSRRNSINTTAAIWAVPTQLLPTKPPLAIASWQKKNFLLVKLRRIGDKHPDLHNARDCHREAECQMEP